MPATRLHDRARIEAFLRRNVYLHLYALGDLDDFFWPHTRWYGGPGTDDLAAVVLLYTGQALPALLALGRDEGALESLLRETLPLLPERFYAHLSPGLEAAFPPGHRLVHHGRHHKMGIERGALEKPPPRSSEAIPAPERLGPDRVDEIRTLYAEAYPDNWFNPRMLETGRYLGLRLDGRLVSIAGVHVYSPRYRVAALGNIATHPEFRGRGLGTAVTFDLCRELFDEADHIGLNVRADNRSAVHCYLRLGFTLKAGYDEYMVSRIGE